jgi:hypothetical protein
MFKLRVSWQQREETMKEIEVRTIHQHGKVAAARRTREIEKTDGRKCRNDLGTKHTHTHTDGRLRLSSLKGGVKKGMSADPHPEGQISPGAVRID